MCFEGSLDDFSIQDILQIVSLTRKSGYLSLDTPLGGGAIIFRRGRILACVEDGEPLVAPAQASPHGSVQDDAICARLAGFVVRIARCRQGAFRFEASASPPGAGEEPGPSAPRRAGMDVVALLIEVAGRTNGNGDAEAVGVSAFERPGQPR